jgi:hypothetical protein
MAEKPDGTSGRIVVAMAARGITPERAGTSLPALVTTASVRAGVRLLEFFAGQIRNPHTRRAYARAAADISCRRRGNR